MLTENSAGRLEGNSNPQALWDTYAELKQYLARHKKGGICIAYSGGVDSTLLLRAAVDAAGRSGTAPTATAGPDTEARTADTDSANPGTEARTADADSANPGTEARTADTDSANPGTEARTADTPRPVLAVILETQLHPHADTEAALARAVGLGADCEVIRVDEFSDPEILKNPANRCYLCKRLLFSSLKQLAAERGYGAVLDGTNKDDEKEYRPGRRALQELGILSPLLELGIRKPTVRKLSALLGLPTASLPSTPCMATRLPYGASLDRALLMKLHEGETFLRGLGFYNVRLRYHAPVLRIEVDTDSFPAVLDKKKEILSFLKELGFPYITLDLEGFRSGSMDIQLSEASGRAGA